MTDFKLVPAGISQDGDLKTKEIHLSAGDAVHNDQHKDLATDSSPQIRVLSGPKSATLNGVVTDGTSADGDASSEGRPGINGSMEGATTPTRTRKGRGT